MIYKNSLDCFKTYDIRGRLDSELDIGIAYRIGRSVAEFLQAKSVVVGFDARKSSPKLAKSVAEGICDAGSNVITIGLAGTEEMYWAVSHFSADAGIEVTASHNPIDYNGMKIVKFSSQPLSEKEFLKIKNLAEKNEFSMNRDSGMIFDRQNEARDAYVNKIAGFINSVNLKPLKIVINSGNGAAGPIVDCLDETLKKKAVETNFVRVHHYPDSSFPNGIPNPLLEENRSATSDIVIRENADFGVAFDGDFDRCFFFDHLGSFIPGEYVVGLLSKIFLNKQKGATIIHDPRVIWNTLDVVKCSGGNAVSSKTGHAFVKLAMREFDAIYGGEMSAHHYFRDFSYCDSGMIPWLVIWELISKTGISLAELIAKRKHRFPSSGETNFTVSDPSKRIKEIKNLYADRAQVFDELDGLSMSFENWRFNLRQSNTEPLVRLNIETQGDQKLLRLKIKELTSLILEL